MYPVAVLLFERFCYDDLNRLTNSNLNTNSADCNGSGSGHMAMGYDTAGMGNIVAKNGLTYTYGAGAGPHAVTSITGTVDGVTNPNFVYDANGNQGCMTTGSDCSGTPARSTTYTSFNMAAQITAGSSSEALTYDSEHGRVTQTDQTGNITTYLADPVAGNYEEKYTAADSTVTWRDYITAPGAGLVALRSLTGTTVTLNYMVTDSLNSVSVLTDASGAVVQRHWFDPWGAQRNADGSADTSCSLPSASLTTRGYTSQEEMPSACLINYNARIYDPQIARFLSADSTTSNPFNGQSLNRYSYVNNSSLNTIDPSGNVNCQQVDGPQACGLKLYGDITPVYANGADWLAIGGGIAGSLPGGIFGGGWSGAGGFGGAFGGFQASGSNGTAFINASQITAQSESFGDTVPGSLSYIPMFTPNFALDSVGALGFGSWIEQSAEILAFHWRYGPIPGSHDYWVRNHICIQGGNCTVQNVRNLLPYAQYPFQFGQPVYNHEPIDILGTRELGITIRQNGLVLINDTQQTHILCCGEV